jgi:hypothetical protein
MKSPTVFLFASSVFLAIVPVQKLAGQSELPADGHWSCVSGYEDNPVFVTPVWDGRAAMDDVKDAFKQFLSAKYSYKGRVSCGRADIGGSTLAGLRAGKEQEQAQWRKNGKTVVQTGWTFGSANAAASPAAGQPAPSPPPQERGGAAATSSAQKTTMYEVCRMLGQGDGVRGTRGITIYFSGIMPRGNVNDEDYANAFSAYMVKRYGLPPRTPECGAMPSRAEAQKAINGWMNESKINKYVQTEWTYTGQKP